MLIVEKKQMQETDGTELISLYDVSQIFNRSIDAMRKYRSLGLIEPCKRVGRKDLYKKKDIIYSKYFIDTKKAEGNNLLEIAKALRVLGEELENFDEHINDKHSKKILILEDSELVNNAIDYCLRKFFTENELTVYYDRDGVIGINHAKKIQPDLIVLDVCLPGRTGIEVYEELSNDPHLSHTKFIFISGSIEYKPKNELFFQKPLNLPAFSKAVKKLTGIQETTNQPKS